MTTSNDDPRSEASSGEGASGAGRDQKPSKDGNKEGRSLLKNAVASFRDDLLFVAMIVSVGVGIFVTAKHWSDLKATENEIKIAEKNVVIASLNAELTRLKAEKATIEVILRDREDSHNPTIQQMLLEEGGDYTWQWAGENWLGIFTFTSTGTGGMTFSVRATMDRVRKTSEDGTAKFERKQIWKTTTNGTAVIDGDVLRINGLKVMATDFEDVPGKHEVDLNMTLTPTYAFTGNVEYNVDPTDTSVSGGSGSMSLVNGRLHQ